MKNKEKKDFIVNMKKRKLGIIVLILAIIFLPLSFIVFKNIFVELAYVILMLILEIGAIILSIITLKHNKVCYILAIIISILGILVYMSLLYAFVSYRKLKDCYPQEGNAYICNYKGYEIAVSNRYLTKDQIIDNK